MAARKRDHQQAHEQGETQPSPADECCSVSDDWHPKLLLDPAPKPAPNTCLSGKGQSARSRNSFLFSEEPPANTIALARHSTDQQSQGSLVGAPTDLSLSCPA